MSKATIDKRDIEFHPLIQDGVDSEYRIIKFEQLSTIADGLALCCWQDLVYGDKKLRVRYEEWGDLLKDLLELGYDRGHSLRHAMLSEYPNIKYSRE